MPTDVPPQAVPDRFRSARSARRSAERSREWEALSAEIRACRRCPLGASRTNAVVYRGGPSPQVVFVGEAPGTEEDRIGLPFVGRSGRILDEAIGRLGLTEDRVGILNVVKCHPPRNRFDRAAARACRPYLERQLELLRPAVVVTLGAWALRSLDPEAPPVLTAAGAPRTGPGGSLFPLLHPAAALRSRRWRERWTRDVAALARWLERPRA